MKASRLAGAALGVAVCLLADVPLAAQTAHFSDATSTLQSGFNNPVGLAMDSSGNIFVADSGNNAVKEIVAAGGYTTVNTLGSGFMQPFAVAVDASGNVFVADTLNNTVKEIVAAGGYTTVNTLGSGFHDPEGVAVDGGGNVFVADSGHNAVKEIVASGGYITVNTLGSGFNDPKGLALDASGNVFVVDNNDIVGNNVKEILATGGYTTVNTLAGGFPCSTVTVDGSGNVYLNNVSGTYGTYAIAEILAVNGSIPASPIIITRGTGLYSPTGLAVDGSGNVFVADQAATVGFVKEISSARGNFTPVNVGSTSSNPTEVLFTFDAAGTLAGTPYQLLTQGAPNLDFTLGTGTTCASGPTYNSGATCLVSVNFKPAVPGPRYGAVELFGTTGNLLATAYLQGTGAGPQATFANTTTGVYLPVAQTILGSGFNGPFGAAVDGSGNVIVADSLHSQVREIVAAGGYTAVNTLGSGFSYAEGVAVDGGGNVFVADTYNSAVKEIVAAGGYTTVNTLGSGFSYPQGVAVDGSGNVFVVDESSNPVKEIVAAGGYTTVNTLGSGFATPNGVAVDGSGNVFVADTVHNTVKEIVAAGGYTTIKTLASGFSYPRGLAVDGSGNVFVADQQHSAVKEIVAAGGYTTVNTLGSGFGTPMGMAVDGSGNVFVTDQGNNRVEKLDYADPPSLSFATTLVGQTSTDSPQTVAVQNIGNAALTFPLPSSGNNPSVSANFRWNGSSTCDQTSASSSTAFSLAEGASCDIAIDFAPTTGGSISGGAVLTDNNLNLTGNMQTIQLNGTGTAIKAVLTSPAPGNTLSGTSATFSWTAGAGVTEYQFRLGTTGSGSSNVYMTTTTALTSPLITGIPAYGVKLYARLYSLINGAWQFNDYTYTESGSPVKAVLTSPTPGSTLTGTSATFSWTAGGGVTTYEFRLGTTGPGSRDLYNAAEMTTTALSSPLITGIPANALRIYARLYSLINGAWQYNDYTYTESGTPTKAVLTSPTPGSTLTGTSATFTWTAGVGVTDYEFRLGTTGSGSSNLYNATTTTLSSPLITGIPAYGVTLYARLYSLIGGAWQYSDYTYTESGSPVKAVLTSPTPGSTLTGSSATFSWTAGGGVTLYEFRVGTTGPGSNNVYNATDATTTALTTGAVTVPTTGATLYARLYSLINGAWQYNDYTYTEQ